MGSKERFYVDIMSMNFKVTGSSHLVVVRFPDETAVKFGVDFGLFQGKDEEEKNSKVLLGCDEIEFVLVTHNHIDHTGRLPLLCKKGFNGKIYATEDTSKLMSNALTDSYSILKKKAKREHRKELYSESDVYKTLNSLCGCKFNETIQLTKNIKATFFINGHLLGAALILVQISFPGYKDINLLFTGDYHYKNMFFDVPKLPGWVYQIPITIIQESTYGYMDSTEVEKNLESNIVESLKNDKTVLCMVFSLGRCQEVLYILKRLQDTGKIDPNIPIYLDGKLAIQYTGKYLKGNLNIREDMKDFLPDNFKYVDKILRNELIDDCSPKVILTTSGMGTYGPATTYISHYISRTDCLIQFTGYTAEGTLGRELKDTPYGNAVSVYGILKRKLARVEYTSELSAHAKADEMIKFLSCFKKINLILVNHGEPEVKQKFAERIVNEVDVKDVAILGCDVLGRNYLYRISPYGLIKSFSTSFE